MYRKVEDWVEVEADDAAEAEHLAAHVPGVLSVFSQTAIRGDRPLGTELSQGVEYET